jgi:hypothetical protein
MANPTVLDEIQTEVDRQKKLGWKDEHSTAGLWVAYICNYVTRWAMPRSFDSKKYTFRYCMIQVAALAVSAIEWFDKQRYISDAEAAKAVSDIKSTSETLASVLRKN